MLMRILRKNWMIVFLGISIVVTGGALVNVSHRVREKQKLVQDISRQIVEEGWAIRALKAEWAYLSRPDRLDELSQAVAQTEPSKPHRHVNMVVMPTLSASTIQNDLDISAVMQMRKPQNRQPHHLPVIKTVFEKTEPQGEEKQPASENFLSLLQQIGGGE